MSERPKTIDAYTWRELATEVEDLRDKVAQLEAEKHHLQEAIDIWHEEELLWKAREAELLEDSERLDKLERDCVTEFKNEHGVRTFTGIQYPYITEAETLREALDKDIAMEEQDHE